MFWRKVFHVLVISVLLMGAFIIPSTAVESKALSKAQLAKNLATSYTVCASSCDFSSIQTAIDSVNAGDTLELAAETFTESITIDKDLSIQGTGSESAVIQAAAVPGVASNRVVNILDGINVKIQGLKIRFGVAPGDMARLGAGIYNGYSTLEISEVSIEENIGADAGGGIFNRGSLTITNSSFYGNSAGNGGGIWHGSNGNISILEFREAKVERN